MSEANRELRRRRRILAATALTGGALLGRSLTAEPDSRTFYVMTGAVAGVWTAGGLASAPDRRRWIRSNRFGARQLASAVALGAGAFTAFYAAARVARRIPPLNDALRSVTAYTREGSDALVLGTALVNGLAEEVFFRGAVYDASGPRHQVAATTAAYVAVTATTRNPALVAAAAVMGWMFASQRQKSGGIGAPIVTHLTWSTLMLRLVPPLFDTTDDRTAGP